MRVLPSDRPELLFEPLEARQLLAGDLPFTLYYPEGFAHGGISEFVPITNPNDQAIEYELHARYAGGERDQLIASGTIAASTRGGVTIARAGNPGELKVRKNAAYALVLKSSGPVSATLSHYDFDVAVGESFTGQTSTEWTFADIQKDSAAVRDFVLFYNPNDHAVTVTLTAFDSEGRTYTLERTVEAQRRGGWNLNAENTLPDGRYGVRLTATAPIVASVSHYEIPTGRGFGSLGQPEGGATAGIITAIDFDDWDDRGGSGDDDGTPDQGSGDFGDDDSSGRGGGGDDDDDSSGRGSGDDDDDDDNSGRRGGDDDIFRSNAFLNLLNTNDAPATVTLTFLSDDSDRRFVGEPRTVEVGANSHLTISIRDLQLPIDDDELGVVYRSDLPVTMTGSVYADRDATGVDAATVAATEWGFAEGFMQRSRAGLGLREELYLFNPTNEKVFVTIEFMTGNGHKVTIVEDLDPLELDDEHVHAVQPLIDLQGMVFYGIRVTATGMIVAGMEHWDRELGGGFAFAGQPRGDVALLSDVLTL